MERRSEERRRTRLRPGKLLSEAGAFVGDMAIVDLGKHGAGIRLFDEVAPPPFAVLLDEGEKVRWRGRLVWDRGRSAAFALLSPADPVDPREMELLAGRYYAAV